MPLQSLYIKLNNVTLHVKTAGHPASPAILFLHGFPSFWYSWQLQIDYFTSLNFYLIVPDQRGYNESGKPEHVSDYRLQLLVEDMVQLLAALNIKQANVVAHDWGGIVGWALIKKHPYLFCKAVNINAPYLPQYAKFSFAQLRKSWYVYFFQLPFFPQWLLKKNECAMLARAMLRTSMPGTFTKEDMAIYRQAWQMEGSVTAMINWYRALLIYNSEAKEIFGQRTPVQIPVLVLWGNRDAFLRKESGICPPKHCTNFSMKVYDDATHWLPIEKSAEVNKAIADFFAE